MRSAFLAGLGGVLAWTWSPCATMAAAEEISVQPATGPAATWSREVLSVSWDGQLVLYEVLKKPGDSSSPAYVYLTNTRTHATTLVADHPVNATLASYGRYLFVAENNTAPTKLMIRDLLHGTTRTETVPGDVTGSLAASSDGRYVTWCGSGDSTVVTSSDGVNPFYAFWHDTVTHTTSLIEPLRFSTGIAISGDGSWVGVLGYTESNPYDLYLIQPTTHRSIPVATMAAQTFPGVDVANPDYALDFGGTLMAYCAYPGTTFSGNRQIHVYNRITAHDELMSVTRSGAPANGDSSDPTISNDGRFVAFSSFATNLVAGVAAGSARIYCYDRVLRTYTLVTDATSGPASRSWTATSPLIDANARHVVFNASAEGLDAGNEYFNGHSQVFESCLPWLTVIPPPAAVDQVATAPHGNG